MELQIQDLISSIKKEGIEAAEAEAEKIRQQALKQAEQIVANAKAEAEKIKTDAKNEIEVLRESARTNAEHARRDAEIAFKASAENEFKKILAADVSKTVNGDTLAKLILAVLGDENPADYTAEVGEVTDALRSELAKKLSEGLEIRIAPDVKRGFRLAAKDQSGYFDCSDEEITRMLMGYFSDLRI